MRLLYQPIVSLEDDRSSESRRSSAGSTRARPVAPDEFIAVAEETGAIIPIGSWVIHEACRTAPRGATAAPAPSARHLRQPLPRQFGNARPRATMTRRWPRAGLRRLPAPRDHRERRYGRHRGDASAARAQGARRHARARRLRHRLLVPRATSNSSRSTRSRSTAASSTGSTDPTPTPRSWPQSST